MWMTPPKEYLKCMKTFLLSQEQKGSTRIEWVVMKDAKQQTMDGKFCITKMFPFKMQYFLLSYTGSVTDKL